MSKEWSQMYGGGRFWPLHPERSPFNIEDIARGLGNTCRYNGQCERFYSVAEHSVHVSRIVQDRATFAGMGRRAVLDIAKWGLLHDASEAHLNDITRPVKHLPDLEGYRRIEKSVMRVIADRFGLPAEEPDLVKDVDTEILGSEVVALLPNAERVEWGKTTATGVLPPPHRRARHRRVGSAHCPVEVPRALLRAVGPRMSKETFYGMLRLLAFIVLLQVACSAGDILTHVVSR